MNSNRVRNSKGQNRLFSKFSGDTTPYHCSSCAEKFRLSRELIAHERKEHPLRLPCPFCPNKTFSSKGTLASHIGNLHRHDKDFRYRCDICDFGYSDETDLSLHYELHQSSSIPFKCVICELEHTNSFDLKKHVKYVHSGFEPLKCDGCDKVFSTIQTLKEHRRIHTEPEKLPTCHICSLVCTNKSKLKQHMNTHSLERNFVCDDCGKAYRDKRVLNHHKRSHAPNLPYPCRLCEKGFASSGMLKVHEEVHTGKRSWMCQFCGKAFVTQHNLHQHLKHCSATKAASRKNKREDYEDAQEEQEEYETTIELYTGHKDELLEEGTYGEVIGLNQNYVQVEMSVDEDGNAGYIEGSTGEKVQIFIPQDCIPPGAQVITQYQYDATPLMVRDLD